MKKSDIIAKMIALSDGNLSDINHFLKVYAFAKSLGELENLSEAEQNILEVAAIVHDIACPLCREKYSSTAGHYQELESETLLREFFTRFDIDSEVLERVIFLVCHHHTYEAVDGADWQLLLEADFLVNAGEKNLDSSGIESFKEKVFKSNTGKQFLDSIYLR